MSGLPQYGAEAVQVESAGQTTAERGVTVQDGVKGESMNTGREGEGRRQGWMEKGDKI